MVALFVGIPEVERPFYPGVISAGNTQQSKHQPENRSHQLSYFSCQIITTSSSASASSSSASSSSSSLSSANACWTFQRFVRKVQHAFGLFYDGLDNHVIIIIIITIIIIIIISVVARIGERLYAKALQPGQSLRNQQGCWLGKDWPGCRALA